MSAASADLGKERLQRSGCGGASIVEIADGCEAYEVLLGCCLCRQVSSTLKKSKMHSGIGGVGKPRVSRPAWIR